MLAQNIHMQQLKLIILHQKSTGCENTAQSVAGRQRSPEYQLLVKVHLITFPGVVMALIMQPIVRKNNKDVKGHPCRTPVLVSDVSIQLPLLRTLHFMPRYVAFVKLMFFCGIPYCVINYKRDYRQIPRPRYIKLCFAVQQSTFPCVSYKYCRVLINLWQYQIYGNRPALQEPVTHM